MARRRRSIKKYPPRIRWVLVKTKRKKLLQYRQYPHRLFESIRHVPHKYKRILLFVFIAFCTFILLDMPDKADATSASVVGEWGRKAAAHMAENQQKVVERYFTGNSPYFSYLCHTFKLFAIFPASFGFTKWLRDEDEFNIWLELVAPVFVLIMLSNGGWILGQIILALYKIFDSILKTMDDYTQFYALIKDGNARAMIGNAISPLYKQCEGLIGQDQSACFSDATDHALSILKEYKPEYKKDTAWLNDTITALTDLGKNLADPKKNVTDKIGTAFWFVTAPAWQATISDIANAVTVGWQFCYGIAFIATGLAAPMAVTASLFSSTAFLASAFVLWLTGMVTLFLARLLLYVGYGIASDLVVSADASADTIWFGVVMAFAIPFLVFEIAKGSASGVWATFVGLGTGLAAAGANLAMGNVGGAAASVAAASESGPPPESGVRVETQY
jgi:hypothetical protein